jgi:PAS domain S-box-containing protein
MTDDSSTRDLLIKALRDICRASVQLEKLDNDRRFTQQVLDGARESYGQLMEEASSPLLLVDPEGNVLSSNKASEILLGYMGEELQHMRVEDLYHDDITHEFGPAFQQILEDGAGTIKDLSAFRKDGQGILVDTLFIVVTHEDRTLVQVTLKEAGERHKRQLEEGRYLEGLELLSRTATGLLEVSPGESIYKRLGNYVGSLVGDAYVIVSSFDKRLGTFSVEAVFGTERRAEIFLGVLLRHLVGVSFRISKEEFGRYVMTCAPASVSGGLQGLFLDKLPKDVYDAMQDFFLFGCTYVAGLTSGGEVFGMAAILMPKGVKLEHPQLVATLMEQGSIVLKHQNREESQPLPRQPEPLIQEFEGALAESILAEELPYPVRHYPTDQYPSTQEATNVPAEGAAQPDYRELRYLLGYKKILVVDEEERVRDVTGGLLAYMGCKVGFAKNGVEAVTHYRKAFDNGEPFEAVILDTSLRGDLGVEETLERLRQIHPRVKVVASISMPDDPIMVQFKELGFRAVVSKPYRSSQLGEVLKKVLNETG